MAVTIEDVLARRIGLQYFDWKLAMEAARVVASHLAHELAWSAQDRDEAVQAYVAKINRWLTAIGLPLTEKVREE
jgi:glycerol-3-phosphate dehydrogenase